MLNVKYIYSNDNKDVIKSINGKIHPETISSIIGLGASGKSTLASLLGGELIPTSGEIIVDEYKTNLVMNNYRELKLKVGFLHQNFGKQVKGEIVKNVIEYYLKKYKYRIETLNRHIKNALKMVGLGNRYLDRKIDTLSQSELKKVALASVLALNPKVIVLDEPTTNLDNSSKNNLIKIIRILKNRFHKTIILTSKDIDLIHKVSDYIYVLSNGKIVKSGTKYEIFTDFEILKKYHISMPKVIEFSKLVLDKKNIKLGYRDEINDLLKDIYRFK